MEREGLEEAWRNKEEKNGIGGMEKEKEYIFAGGDFGCFVWERSNKIINIS